MWIKLDFTSFFVGAVVVGLVLVAIGLCIRSSFPNRSTLAIFIVVTGAIPVLLGGFGLLEKPIADWRYQRKYRTSIEQLTEDREIQGIRLPRGAKVEWHGKLMSSVILAQPLTVLGMPLEGELKFDTTTTGNDVPVAVDLETATLATDHSIGGVPCKAHRQVEFFASVAPDTGGGLTPKAAVGKLKRCTSSAAFDFRGNRYQADAEVLLNSSGAIGLGLLAVDQDVDGHWCKQGTKVERLGERAIRFTLARNQKVAGIACKAGEEVVIEPSGGSVTSAVLAHDQEIGGIPCRGGDAVGFGYVEGSYLLDKCVISRPVTILNVSWPPGSSLKGLSMGWLGATLPLGSTGVVIGEVKIVGRCDVDLTKTPLTLDRIESLEGKAAYAELRGARFAWFNIYDGAGWGQLAEPATVEGVAYGAGATVRLKIGPPK